MARPAPTTVVVLEDHQDNRDLFVHELAEAGFNAVALAPSVDHDVVYLIGTLSGPVAVLVDVGARRAGSEVAQGLAALEPRPRLIAVTGQHPDDVPNAGIFDAYLMKPFLGQELVAAVRGALTGDVT